MPCATPNLRRLVEQHYMVGAGRPTPETAIRNLYCVGHWTQPGGGITPVIVSAQRVAQEILRLQN